MEAEWHVLTLLKIHVRTSHVSCLTHIFGGAGGGGGGGGEGAVGANPQPLEAVAQYPTNICAWTRMAVSQSVLVSGGQQQQTDMPVKYEFRPYSMLPPPPHTHTSCHVSLDIKSTWLYNKRGGVSR